MPSPRVCFLAAPTATRLFPSCSTTSTSFLDFRDAINVLKHGAGRSHDRLLGRGERLDFSVRAQDEPFHDEGDVSEVSTLVRADIGS